MSSYHSDVTTQSCDQPTTYPSTQRKRYLSWSQQCRNLFSVENILWYLNWLMPPSWENCSSSLPNLRMMTLMLVDSFPLLPPHHTQSSTSSSSFPFPLFTFCLAEKTPALLTVMVSLGLDYSTQLFIQTLIDVLHWRNFVDVVKHPQSIGLSRLPVIICVSLI